MSSYFFNGTALINSYMDCRTFESRIRLLSPFTRCLSILLVVSLSPGAYLVICSTTYLFFLETPICPLRCFTVRSPKHLSYARKRIKNFHVSYISNWTIAGVRTKISMCSVSLENWSGGISSSKSEFSFFVLDTHTASVTKTSALFQKDLIMGICTHHQRLWKLFAIPNMTNLMWKPFGQWLQ